MDAESAAGALRLAVLTSHPIQYNAPAFRSLAAEPGVELRVFYEWEGTGNAIDPEFGRPVTWDVPLFDGYDHVFSPNASRNPGSHSFWGIDNPDIVKHISSWRPDALLVYGWSFRSHLRVLRAFRGKVPILFRGDSNLLSDGHLARTLARRALLKWVYSHVDVGLYTGTRNREYYHVHGLRDDQLVWAPHAVDNAYFSAADEEREAQARAWRAQLGIAPGDTVFLFSGKIVARKDPLTLLEAFLNFRRAAPDRGAHLVYAGEGELANRLLATANGRSDVHFLGFRNQTEMPVVYRLGDVTVLPSSHLETWGLAINEAMACGRAGVVSDGVGCAVDLIHAGKTGMVFERGNQTDLEGKLELLSRNREDVVRMGKQAKAMIANWSIPAYTTVVSRVVKAVGGQTAVRGTRPSAG